MSTFKKYNLKEQIYTHLRQKIITGFYVQDEKIIIDKIAKELNVSNSPVREAINLLISNGLIVKKNHEIRIVKLSSEDITEITESFIVLLLTLLIWPDLSDSR